MIQFSTKLLLPVSKCLSQDLPPSGCRHLPPQAGEGFLLVVLRPSLGKLGTTLHICVRLSFPCEAGEGAEGGWGRSVHGHVSSLPGQSLQTTKSHSPPEPSPFAQAGSTSPVRRFRPASRVCRSPPSAA